MTSTPFKTTPMRPGKKHEVDLILRTQRDFPDQVWWSENFNSYALVETPDGPWLLGETPVSLVAFHGATGEIRWDVSTTGWTEERSDAHRDNGFLGEGAVEHFGLQIRPRPE